MATIRIRGTWQLTFSVYEGDRELRLRTLEQAELMVRRATRAVVEAELRAFGTTIPMRGRVRPGSPAIVTLSEHSRRGTLVKDGLEAIFYIPSWWPNVDYSYDFIVGTIVMGSHTSARKRNMERKLISVAGVQPFE